MAISQIFFLICGYYFDIICFLCNLLYFNLHLKTLFCEEVHRGFTRQPESPWQRMVKNSHPGKQSRMCIKDECHKKKKKEPPPPKPRRIWDYSTFLANK